MKILSEYLESLVKGFDPSRPVFFRKNVTDCEHWGDMADARACVECKMPCGRAREVMESGFYYYDPWQ